MNKLVRPTLDTRYHIDFNWWNKSGRDLRVYLFSHLCDEHQTVYKDYTDTESIDWVDPDTAEVRQVDGLQHTLHMHCSQQPGYLTQHTTLVDAVFRVFLANSNQPVTVRELGVQLGKDPQMILRTLSGAQVYKGLRPFSDSGGA
jgi:hypothetical protein